MPRITKVDFKGTGTMNMWNLDTRVGGVKGVTQGLNVKLCQYLFYATTTPRGKRFAVNDVIGIWGPKSKAVLANIEAKNDVLKDGAIDPIMPGQDTGSISHKIYKMILLQFGYLNARFGGESPGDLLRQGKTMKDLEDALMAMPNEDEMPSDLSFDMLKARDGLDLFR